MTLTDSQEKLLKLLQENGYSTVSELAELTGFSQKDIRFDLLRLIQQEHVVNIKKLHAFSIYFYRGFLLEVLHAEIPCTKKQVDKPVKPVQTLLELVVPVPETAPLPLLINDQKEKSAKPYVPEFDEMKEDLRLSLQTPFMTISHQVGWNRVAALKRIRDRLIGEYHPILNSVIADYESMLRLKEN